MAIVQAQWLVPISSPPVREGWIRHDGGIISSWGGPESLPPRESVVGLPDSAVMPALVNAHTHLELSWLRGRIQPAPSFSAWLTAMMRERLQAPEARDVPAQREAMARALAEMRASGTGLVGDISNSLLGFDLLGRSGLSGVVFHELIALDPGRAHAAFAAGARRLAETPAPAGWRTVLTPHAPYSVSAPLFEALRDAAVGTPLSVHVAEPAEELELLASGGGTFRALFEQMGVWSDAWVPPGCGPIEYLDHLGVWRPGALAVHAVRATVDDARLLAARGATIVTCPRSNLFVGAGTPPVASFYASGAPVAVGTDSLASTPDLNLFAELAQIRRLAPGVPAGRILESGTLTGARALGLGDSFGSIEAGKRASLLAVRLPPRAGSVEQCLLDGVVSGQVDWLSTES